MFEKVTEQLLDLRVTGRGTPAVGNALRLCIFGVLAFLALVPVARADTGTTTTPSPAGQSPTVASTTPQQQYWVIPGSGPVTVHFDYVSRNAICADTLGVFKVDSADGAINGTLPGDPAWPAQVHPQVVFSSSSSPGASADLTFQGGDILAFAFDGCSGRVYSYVAANPAGQAFVLTSEDATGAWTLAWEDGGDFDYNDLVVSVTGLLGGADPTAGTGSGDVPATDFAYAGGCSSTSTAGAPSACAQSAECKGANTRWGVANGQATWTNLFGIVMWRYYATVRVCIDIKHHSILAYDSETSEAADVFKPVWSYDDGPRWDVGPVGMKVQQSWVRVTDSFTGCPILGVPIGCNHEVFSITFNVNGAGSYSTTDRFN